MPSTHTHTHTCTHTHSWLAVFTHQTSQHLAAYDKGFDFERAGPVWVTDLSLVGVLGK